MKKSKAGMNQKTKSKIFCYLYLFKAFQDKLSCNHVCNQVCTQSVHHSFFRVSQLLQTTVFHHRISKSTDVLGAREMRMWNENGEQEKHNYKDCTCCCLILSNSSFHCHTPYKPGTSPSLSISHLNGLVPPPASFCCLYSPIFFPSILFRTQLLFSGFLIRSQN